MGSRLNLKLKKLLVRWRFLDHAWSAMADHCPAQSFLDNAPNKYYLLLGITTIKQWRHLVVVVVVAVSFFTATRVPVRVEQA